MSTLENSHSMARFALDNPVPAALRAIARGQPIILEHDEYGADLVLAAELADQRNTAFVVRHTSGLLTVPLPRQRCDELQLPPMTLPRGEVIGAIDASAVAVDAAEGVSTGISARDRSKVIRLLAAESTRPRDLRRPGHVVPLRTDPAGVLRSPRPAEACVDICRLAGLRPAAARAEMLSPDGTIPSPAQLRTFGAAHGLVRLTIEDIIAYQHAFDVTVRRLAEWRMTTEYGEFRVIGYHCAHDDTDHLALVMGDPGTAHPVREHRECTHGDVFGSLDCACAATLREGLRSIAHAGAGLLVYLRNGARLGGFQQSTVTDIARAHSPSDSGSVVAEVGAGGGLEHPVAAAILRELNIADSLSDAG